MEITLLHQTGPLLTVLQMVITLVLPPYLVIVTQKEITLLHQPLLIYFRWRLPYYTTPTNLPPDGDNPTAPPSANLLEVEITLLHQRGPY